MASNLKQLSGATVTVGVSTSTVNSGDPWAVGKLTGVAEANKDSANNVVLNREGIYRLTVQAVDNTGTAGADANVAVAIGDVIYIDTSRSSTNSKLTKRADGVKFGLALGAVTSGGSAAIDVLLQN